MQVQAAHLQNKPPRHLILLCTEWFNALAHAVYLLPLAPFNGTQGPSHPHGSVRKHLLPVPGSTPEAGEAGNQAFQHKKQQLEYVPGVGGCGALWILISFMKQEVTLTSGGSLQGTETTRGWCSRLRVMGIYTQTEVLEELEKIPKFSGED